VRAILILLALFASTTARAAGNRTIFDTGNEFLAMCDDVKNGHTYCLGTAVGYADMLLWSGMICAPGRSFPKGQVIDVVIKYVRDHPAERSRAAASLAYDALTDAFPCSQK
jgi:hypothetical protein